MTPSRKLLAMIRLYRPELPIAAGICVVTGQIVAAGSFPSPRTGLLAFICVFCLSAAALIFNDYFDYEVDRINAPERPLPSGAVTPTEALWLGAMTTLAGLASALALGLAAFLVSIPIWLIGFLYNWRYKESGLPGNLMVSVSVAATFWFGALTVGAPWMPLVWIFSAIAFFLDLGEEIAGDAMDSEGDKKRGSRSIAILKGRAFALRLAVAAWAVVMLLSLLPVALGLMERGYLALFLVSDAVLAYFSIRLLRSRNPQSGRSAMRGAYLGATLAILAYLIGQVLK